jgi:hypothetical protein
LHDHLEEVAQQTQGGLRLQRLEKGRWRGDLLADWTTGTGRERKVTTAA